MPKLSENYWDCECSERYIQRNTREECPICGARSDDSPDSREDEISEGTHFAESRQSYFYTFGSDEQFAHQNGWVEIRAANWEEAHEKFRSRFPDRPGHEGTINCAFFYDEERWRQMDPENKWSGYKCYAIIN